MVLDLKQGGPHPFHNLLTLILDDAARGWIVLSLTIFILLSTPIWWITTDNSLFTHRPHVPDIESERSPMIVLNYIPLELDLNLDQLHKHSSKIAIDLESPRDIPGADELPMNGPAQLFFDKLAGLPQPEPGTFNIYVIRAVDYEWRDRLTSPTSEINMCSRNQVVIVHDEGTSLAQIQLFHNKLVAELTQGLVDPVFGLDSQLLVRFTLLTVGDAPVLSEQFRKDYERSMEPVITALSKTLPIRTVFQTRLMQSFAEPAGLDSKRNIYFFTETQVSTLMRSGAWNLDLTTGNKNAVNFVIIFAKPKQPLHIVDSSGGLIPAVLYPNWGGAFIWNQQDANASPCAHFAGHLFELLGLNHSAGCSTISPIDKDRLMLSIFNANLQRIQSAHSAFNDLLAKSPFIKINSELSRQLSTWAKAAWMTIFSLDSRSLTEGVKASALCAEKAEAAYYHPSLMGRMYFPEEHKMAVYLPLLLPSLLPVAAGILKILYGRFTNRII